jgi:hypothetical protein
LHFFVSQDFTPRKQPVFNKVTLVRYVLRIPVIRDFSLDTGLKVELNDLLEETPGHKVAPPGESLGEGSAILSDLPLGRDVSANRLEPIGVKQVIQNI